MAAEPLGHMAHMPAGGGHWHDHGDGVPHFHAHDHGHAHGHGHDHAHPVYPHADHPLGPLSALKTLKR
jgi:sirohydrochlorin cobaltochelatase